MKQKRINLVYLVKHSKPMYMVTDNPSHISTHYSYAINPLVSAYKSARDGFAPRPIAQRKHSSNKRDTLTTHAATIDVPTTYITPQAKRKKFRKNIDKAALAEYFDNDILPSRTEIAQKNLDTWLMQTMFELENADIEKAEQNVTHSEIRDFIESRIDKFNTEITFDFLDPDVEHNEDIEATPNDLWDKIATYAHDLDNKENNPTPKYKFECSKNEINESIIDRFVKKYDGTDTAAAMRALDKKNAHGRKIARLMHELQITK